MSQIDTGCIVDNYFQRLSGLWENYSRSERRVVVELSFIRFFITGESCMRDERFETRPNAPANDIEELQFFCVR